MKTLNITLFTLILLTIFLVSPMQTSARYSVFVSINDAYYGDLDQDMLEDDIRVTLTLEIYNNKVQTSVDLYLGITLPSGYEHWFLAEFVAIKYSYYGWIVLEFDLLNVATESGWYDASSVGFADQEQFSIMDTYTFDPPGEGDGDPVSASFRSI